MIAALLIAAIASNGTASSSWLLFAQGRASSVTRIADAAKRCGIHHIDFEIMRGPVPFRDSDEAGAELSLLRADISPAAEQCFRRSAALLRKRYRDVHYFPDTF